MGDACGLCGGAGGTPVWRDERGRVVIADEPFAGFCRVIWNAHVREMTDLEPPDRAHLMRVAWAVEAALRRHLRPIKMNLASLGNVTPHLHWHVVPRFADDSHYPRPIWDGPLREGAMHPLPEDFTATLGADLRASLDNASPRGEA